MANNLETIYGDLVIQGSLRVGGGLDSNTTSRVVTKLGQTEGNLKTVEATAEAAAEAASAAQASADLAAAAAGVTTAYTSGTYTPLAPTVSYVITKRIALIGITPQDTLLNADGWDVQISRDGLTWYCPNILASSDADGWYSGDEDDYLTIASPILTLGYLPITLSSGLPLAAGETYYFRVRARCSSPESQSDWTTSGALVAYPTLSADLAAAAVAEANLADSCVTTNKLYANAVTAGKLGVTNLDVDGSANVININARLLYSGATAGAYSAYTGVGALLLTSPSAYAGSYALNYFDLDTGKLRIGTTSKYLYFNGTTLKLSGELIAATGTFSGSLSAATGTFSGSLSAVTGTFSGELIGATITTSLLKNSSDTLRLAPDLSGNTEGIVLSTGSIASPSAGASKLAIKELEDTSLGMGLVFSRYGTSAWTQIAYLANTHNGLSLYAYGGLAVEGDITVDGRGSFTGGIAGHYYHSSAATQNGVFDALSSYIPSVGNVLSLSGGFAAASSPYLRILTTAIRTSSTVITLYAISEGGVTATYTMTNGSTTAVGNGEMSISWN